MSGAQLYLTNLNGADLTSADLNDSTLLHVRVNQDTRDFNGTLLSSHIEPTTSVTGLGAGTVRIQKDLPMEVDPQVLADYATSVAVMARLVSRVGARLERERFGEYSSEPGGNIMITTAGDLSEIRVRRTHFGSPWYADLAEYGPIIQSATTVIGSVASAFVLRKNGRQVLSFLLTLIRREERELWLAERVEERKLALENKRADTQEHMKRRVKDEIAVAKLRIEPGSEVEFSRRVTEAVLDPQTRELILAAIPSLQPLIADGLMVTTVSDATE